MLSYPLTLTKSVVVELLALRVEVKERDKREEEDRARSWAFSLSLTERLFGAKVSQNGKKKDFLLKPVKKNIFK